MFQWEGVQMGGGLISKWGRGIGFDGGFSKKIII